MLQLSAKNALFLQNQLALRLLSLLNHKSSDSARFVGGCVRNAVMECSSAKDDIDIATVFSPQIVKEICKKAGIRTVDTGIEHGTITALLENQSFEITTLRKDVKTDGRHAVIEFCTSYSQDAQRRDFTYNALYADERGKVYDETDGVRDAQLRKTRFIGDAEQRIKEDYLRILRFFRFQSCYGAEPVDLSALSACTKNAEHLAIVSRERVRNEWFKWLQGKSVVATLRLAENAGVLTQILPQANNGAEVFSAFGAFSGAYPSHYYLTFLSSAETEKLKEALRLTVKEEKSLLELQEIDNELRKTIISPVNFLLLRERHSEEAIRFVIEKNLYFQPQARSYYEALREAQSLPLPQFNITGKTLIAEGVTPGPHMAQEILRRKQALAEQYLHERQANKSFTV